MRLACGGVDKTYIDLDLDIYVDQKGSYSVQIRSRYIYIQMDIVPKNCPGHARTLATT